MLARDGTEPKENPATDGALPARPLSQPSILHVEDRESILISVAAMLDMEGFRVVSCQDPVEAQAALQTNTFALAIIDGDLGDKRVDADGMAGQLVTLLLSRGIRVIRLTSDPECIAAEVRGEAVYDKQALSDLIAWIHKNVEPRADVG